VGASQAQVDALLRSWKKQNKTSVNSVDELLAALNQVNFWKNFNGESMGAENFQMISKRCPNLKKEVTTELFHVFDKDHDGQVSAKEFLTGVLEGQSTDPKKEAEMLFDGWDEDNSGSLSKDEVKKLWSTRRTGEHIILAYTARTLLHNTAISGNIGFLKIFPTLKRDQLETFASQTAAKGSKDYLNAVKTEEKKKLDSIVDAIFVKADTDKNGTLSKQEFIDFFTNEDTVSQIRDLSSTPESDALLEHVTISMSYGFLLGTSDEIAKKCGAKIKDLMEDKDHDDLGGIPADVWANVLHTLSSGLKEWVDEEKKE
jgi:Ca2+-binding EF-hand superfamily protein